MMLRRLVRIAACLPFLTTLGVVIASTNDHDFAWSSRTIMSLACRDGELGDWCRETQLPWNRIQDEEARFELMQEGWRGWHWSRLEPHLRWYHYCEWEELSDLYQTSLQKIGWTEKTWNEKYETNTTECNVVRPLVELRPWSRLTESEQQVASDMGFNEYTWHTKDAVMAAWQPDDGMNALAQDVMAKPVPTTLMSNHGFEPTMLTTLNIPELARITWDALEQSDEMVEMEDPEDRVNAPFGNDETINTLQVPMRDFIRGVRSGKPYYIKLEDAAQHVIQAILGSDVTLADILGNALAGTRVGDFARVGPIFAKERIEQVVQLYIGGKSTVSNMHLDLQSFNFLYIGHGRKRIRLLPNDQRTAANFTFGLEAHYSVWTGYNLLHASPIPEHGVEFILEAGQGVAVPYHTWHAVENLEPTIAFGLIREFPYMHSRKSWCEGGGFPLVKAVKEETSSNVPPPPPPPPPLLRKREDKEETSKPEEEAAVTKEEIPDAVSFPSAKAVTEKLCKSDWCRQTLVAWNKLPDTLRSELEEEGWRRHHWESLEPHLRWYHMCEWNDLSRSFQSGLKDLGWTREAWMRKYDVNTTQCTYERPLVELRSWSRLTTQEQAIARGLGFDEYTWHTKEIAMSGWQPHHGKAATLDDIPATYAMDYQAFEPLKLTLDIPELAQLTWDVLEQSTERIFMEDPDDRDKAAYGNDEQVGHVFLTMQEFIRGIKAGKPYYIKLENNEQSMIQHALGGDVSIEEILMRHLEGTKVGDVARIGKKYAGEQVEGFMQLYIGGKSTVTNMHLDIQSFNFLYVAAGRKRVRLLPNDQRYASNFTWGYELWYSVWTGFDLLHADPIPEGGVEIILEAGQGVAIPYMTWHAVENLEPTIAFGLIRDFPYTQSQKTWCDADQPLQPKKHEGRLRPRPGKVAPPPRQEQQHPVEREYQPYFARRPEPRQPEQQKRVPEPEEDRITLAEF